MSHYLGVEFIYQSSPEVTVQRLQPSIGNRPATSEDISKGLTDMPPEWLAKLRQASSQLKGKQVMQLIQEMPADKSAIATRLQTLAENYQFDEIVSLLDVD